MLCNYPPFVYILVNVNSYFHFYLSFAVKQFTSTVFFLFLSLCAGCGSRSLEDFREEGNQATDSLVAELRQIQTRRDLIEAAPKLKQSFNRLAALMVAAREFQKTHPDHEKLELQEKDHALSEQLRAELNRLYEIEGGREIIEKYQEEALRRLSL